MTDFVHGMAVGREIENRSNDWKRIKIAQLQAENNELRRVIGFLTSVVKSGEGWTSTCEEMITKACMHGEKE